MTKLSTQNTEEKGKEGDIPVVVMVDGLPEKGLTRQVRPIRAELGTKSRCLKIGSVICLLACLVVIVLTSCYIYKGMHTKRFSKSWHCRVPVAQKDGSRPHYLKQEVNVTDDNVETIKVPKFDDNDEAEFIHDFAQEISVIKDDTDKLCYIMPLNKKLVPRPRSFWDLYNALQSGVYQLDPDQIQSKYQVVHPALSKAEVSQLYGSYISARCAEYKSYKLSLLDQAMTTTTTMATYVMERRFVMYPGGRAVLQYIIYRV